jgi:hypothetical protein
MLVAAAKFLDAVSDPISGGASSVPGGPLTLYGTCYATLAKSCISAIRDLSERTRDFLTRFQDSATGLMVGPELTGYSPSPGALHDLEHLKLHLTCATLGTCQHFDVPVRYKIREARKFCNLDFLNAWLGRRDFNKAWFEGNNLLFVAQLLVYLRDVEDDSTAKAALELWFRWLEDCVDPATSLWGTNGHCDVAEAAYGGYHQLLVYFHEGHPIRNPRGLVNAILALQHGDGGFRPSGNAGACEDVDCVDILVNLYKRFDYRRAEIRHGVRRCVHHILSTQNLDGGFPYSRGVPQSHMGIPGTTAAANVSTTFATWFRIHTLALCAEIIPEHPAFNGINFGFSRSLSMGWHASPPTWTPNVDSTQRLEEWSLAIRSRVGRRSLQNVARRGAGKLLRSVGLR